MNLRSENVLWMLQWFPILFDVLMVVLLLAGCLLFWLSFRSGKAIIPTVMQTADCDVEARYRSDFAPASPAGTSPKHRTNSLASPPSEARGAETRGPNIAVDQNSNAARVASAHEAEARRRSELAAPQPEVSAEPGAHALAGSEGPLSADAGPRPGLDVDENSLAQFVSEEFAQRGCWARS